MPKIFHHNQALRCPLCHGKSYEKIFSCMDADRVSQMVFEVVRCRTCKLVFTHPRLSEEDLNPWYRPLYHGWWQTREPRLFGMLSRLFQLNRSRWIIKHVPKGTLLDIGCGDGNFIAFMSGRGWDVFGIENSDKYKHISQGVATETKICRHNTDKWDHLFAPSNVITFWHVLEHVEDPVKTLRQAHNALKPSGLLVLSIPNFKSLQAALCQDRWFHLDVPRHRWHFTPETITRLLRRSGFFPIGLSHFSLEYNPFGWWQSLLNLSGCTHNFAYNLLKRREMPTYKNMFQGAYDMICSMILGILFVPIALTLAVGEALIRRGGTITVVARKK